MKRTSLKTFALGTLFGTFYCVGIWFAERYHKNTSTVDFGFEREWNRWDYASISSLVLGAAFVLVSVWLYRKGD